MTGVPPQFILTDHAKKRMAERSISEELITEALRNPTKIGRGKQQRILIKKIYERGKKKRLLLLALEREAEKWCIITVIDTTKIQKYL